jgi:hypothetical protein
MSSRSISGEKTVWCLPAPVVVKLLPHLGPTNLLLLKMKQLQIPDLFSLMVIRIRLRVMMVVMVADSQRKAKKLKLTVRRKRR